jgi:hypothetical protein
MDSHRNKQTAENQEPNHRNVLRTNITPLTLLETLLLSAVLVAFAPGAAGAQTMEKKGTTPYVTHFIFRPVQSLEVPGLGTATLLEAVGTTQNMKGEKMLDKMSARCTALSVDSGPKKYIDGACILADADGDKIFSTFEPATSTSRSQPSIAALTSLPVAPGSMQGSPGASHLHATQCLHWLGRVATPRWTSRIIRRGRSNNLSGAAASLELSQAMLNARPRVDHWVANVRYWPLSGRARECPLSGVKRTPK